MNGEKVDGALFVKQRPILGNLTGEENKKLRWRVKVNSDSVFNHKKLQFTPT